MMVIPPNVNKNGHHPWPISVVERCHLFRIYSEKNRTHVFVQVLYATILKRTCNNCRINYLGLENVWIWFFFYSDSMLRTIYALYANIFPDFFKMNIKCILHASCWVSKYLWWLCFFYFVYLFQKCFKRHFTFHFRLSNFHFWLLKKLSGKKNSAMKTMSMSSS